MAAIMAGNVFLKSLVDALQQPLRLKVIFNDVLIKQMVRLNVVHATQGRCTRVWQCAQHASHAQMMLALRNGLVGLYLTPFGWHVPICNANQVPMKRGRSQNSAPTTVILG